MITYISTDAHVVFILERDEKAKRFEIDVRNGVKFPPIKAEKYGWGYVVRDGHHRMTAYKLANKPCPVDIVEQGA